MKERLDELTVSDFILLLSGDTGVLLDGDEKVSADSLAVTARNLLYEYREIVDPSGMKSYLIETEELLKANINLEVLTICSSLLSLGYIDEAVRVLEELGINGAKMSVERLRAVVKSNLARAKVTIEDIVKSRLSGNTDKTDIRKYFDEQTVALMAHFKFQIDTAMMKASIYAHLVSRFNREVKMMGAAMKKRR